MLETGRQRVFDGIDALATAVGTTLGRSDYLTISQERVTAFAHATGDLQWIHVDAERAALGPFGGTIAHGFLTLSVVPVLLRDIYRVDGLRMAVNYGCDRVRFPGVVPVGSRVCAEATLLQLEWSAPDVARMTLRVQVEREGGDRPVCVLESVTVLYG